MINDKMDIEAIICHLSTRATILFAHDSCDDSEILAVSIGANANYPSFWQVWFEHYIGGKNIKSDVCTFSLQEGTSLWSALYRLDEWLDMKENDAVRRNAKDAENIIESIGFGD